MYVRNLQKLQQNHRLIRWLVIISTSPQHITVAVTSTARPSGQGLPTECSHRPQVHFPFGGPTLGYTGEAAPRWAAAMGEPASAIASTSEATELQAASCTLTACVREHSNPLRAPGCIAARAATTREACRCATTGELWRIIHEKGQLMPILSCFNVHRDIPTGLVRGMRTLALHAASGTAAPRGRLRCSLR